MNLTILDITLPLLVYKLKQSQVAASIACTDATLSKILSGALTPNLVPEIAQAFMNQFPILEVLRPGGKHRIIRAEPEYAPTILLLSESALLKATTESEKWDWHRHAADALMEIGVLYNFDPDTGKVKLEVIAAHLDAARQHYHALLDLKIIPPAYSDVLRMGVVYNGLAIDMLLERGAGSIAASSQVLTDFAALFSELVGAYRAMLDSRARRQGARKEDDIDGSDNDAEVAMPNEEVVMRTLLLFAAAAYSELLIESGGKGNVFDSVVKPLQEAIDVDDPKVIALFLRSMAWEHNRPAYLDVFEKHPAVLKVLVPKIKEKPTNKDTASLEHQPDDKASGGDKPRRDNVEDIAWWNALTEADRTEWMKIAGTGVLADAWAAYKRQHPGSAAAPGIE